MRTTRRRARVDSEVGPGGGPGVGLRGDARDLVVAEALRNRSARSSRLDAERLHRFCIVLVSEDEVGKLHGVVEAVRGGRKERFQRLDTRSP